MKKRAVANIAAGRVAHMGSTMYDIVSWTLVDKLEKDGF
jgi:hypothetical protein